MAKRLVGLERKSFKETMIDHLECLANQIKDDNFHYHKCGNDCPQKELCTQIEKTLYEKLYM